MDPIAPPPPDPSARPRRREGALTLATLGLVLVVAVLAVAALLRPPTLPPATASRLEVTPTPNVVMSVRELSRLQTAETHLERVVELKDHQSKLWGLVNAEDAILLVAAGDVTAGIDLTRLAEDRVTVDWEKRKVTIRPPAPEVFAARLDSERTHVHARTTDTLATRREGLEGMARAEAERSMQKAAIDAGLLDRARASAERTLSALLRSLGFVDVQIEW